MTPADAGLLITRLVTEGLAQARRSRVRIILALCIIWLITVVAVYYVEVGRLLAGRGSPWMVLDGTPDFSLPFVGEALLSAVRGLAGALALVAAALALGLALCRAGRSHMETLAARVPVAVSLGIGAFSYTALLLSAAGMYRPWVLRLIIGLTLSGAVVAVARRGRPLLSRASLRAVMSRRSQWLWITCMLLAVGAALFAALAPEYQYDAVWYHLYFPRLFLERGHMVDLPGEFVSLYPMTWDLWLGYGLAISGQTTATLLHFACLPLTAAMVYEMARRYASGVSPWLAAAIFCTVPTVMWEASTAYIDLAIALQLSIAIYSLLRYLEQRTWEWLLLATISLGIALASKHLALVALAVACSCLAVALWMRHSRILQALRPAVFLCFGALLFASPWYLRSWLGSGNPVFPELYHLFGGPANRWDEMTNATLEAFFARFGRPRTVWNQLSLPWDMTMHEARYAGAFGPLFLALLPMLAIRSARRRPGALSPRRRQIPGLWFIGLFAATYFMLWASPVASFQMRWLVPIAPLLAILAAAGFARLTSLFRAAGTGTARTMLRMAVAAVLMLNLPLFSSLHQRDRAGDFGWITHILHGVPLVVIGAESRDQYLSRHIPTYRAWQVANDMLPPTARVLAWSGGDHFYSNAARLWVLTPVGRDAAFEPSSGGTEQALEGLRALGITHLLIDHGFLRSNGFGDSADWSDYALTNPAVRPQLYDVLYEDGRAALYRLKAQGR